MTAPTAELAPEPPADPMVELAEIHAALQDTQATVLSLSERRIELIRQLHTAGVSHKTMAGTMGISVGSMYRIAPARVLSR